MILWSLYVTFGGGGVISAIILAEQKTLKSEQSPLSFQLHSFLEILMGQRKRTRKKLSGSWFTLEGPKQDLFIIGYVGVGSQFTGNS